MNSESPVLCVNTAGFTGPPFYWTKESSIGGHCVSGIGLAVTKDASRLSTNGGIDMM